MDYTNNILNTLNINIILAFLGTFFFIISIIIQIKFSQITKKTSLLKWWLILFVLIIFFTIGSISFGYTLLTKQNLSNFFELETILGLILFLGSIFVILSTQLIYSFSFKLKNEKKKLQKALDNLEKEKSKTDKKIQERTEDLEKINKLMTGRELKMIEYKKILAETETIIEELNKQIK